MTKEARIYNGEKTVSLTSGAGKTLSDLRHANEFINPEINPRIYGHLILTKETRIYNGLKTISLTSGAGKTGQPLAKE